jgi:hypothetical protein
VPKAIVVDAATDEILWQDYQRHWTKQLEKTLEAEEAEPRGAMASRPSPDPAVQEMAAD